MKENRSERINKISLSETISEKNVKYFGEMMAICAMKGILKYYPGAEFDRLYKGLILDIMRSNKLGHTFSDGYDFAQEAMVFLCNHYGKKLNDILGTDKRNRIVTVKKACLTVLSSVISAKFRRYRSNMNIEDFYHLEATQELEIKQEEDCSVVDNIIETLNLTDRQMNALLCRMNGMSYPEAGRFLSMGATTVFDIISKIRKIYISLYSEPRVRARI